MSDSEKLEPLKVPEELKPENIGKIVVIQTFRRNDADTIHHDTLTKVVGMLEGYSFNSQVISINLRGMDEVLASRRKHFVEVYIKE